jgi:hypothetical protein
MAEADVPVNPKPLLTTKHTKHTKGLQNLEFKPQRREHKDFEPLIQANPTRIGQAARW